MNEYEIMTRSGTGVREKGRLRIEKIIEFSKKILIAEGYGALTMRNIANSAGVSLGTLTYYFKKKEDLFQSLFIDFTQKHEKTLQRNLNAGGSDAMAEYLALIETLLEESKDEFLRAYFYNLWAGSVHDPFLRGLREEIYSRFFDEVETIFKKLLTTTSTAEIQQKVFIFISIIEGLHVTHGTHKTQLKPAKGYEQQLLEVLKGLVAN